jgi:hypothetical protein
VKSPFIHSESKGPAWVRLCIAGLQRAIKRAESQENPNAMYLRTLETILQAYKDGKVGR